MSSTASKLRTVIDEYLPQLNQLNEEESTMKPSPSKWSKKEIIGHLIDSAQNNIRRFIVAQYEENALIIYKQDEWVSVNNYQSYTLSNLIQLWYLLNKQIATLLSNLSEKELNRTSKTDSVHTVEWLAADYIKHLKHHLHQILNLPPISYP